MKINHSPDGQAPKSNSEGFQMLVSERAFIALLKTIIFLILFATQGQSVVDTVGTQIPFPLQSQQDYLP
jgi:mannose/fructose/N-acetylgalactosamine-specific phosphotransferase system component IIC